MTQCETQYAGQGMLFRAKSQERARQLQGPPVGARAFGLGEVYVGERNLGQGNSLGRLSLARRR